MVHSRLENSPRFALARRDHRSGSPVPLNRPLLSAQFFAAAANNLTGSLLQSYDSDPLDENRWQDGNRAASRQSQQAANTRLKAANPLHAALGRRTLLCMDPMLALHPHSLGVLHPELALVRSSRALIESCKADRQRRPHLKTVCLSRRQSPKWRGRSPNDQFLQTHIGQRKGRNLCRPVYAADCPP